MLLDKLIAESSRHLAVKSGDQGQVVEPVPGLWLLRHHEPGPYRASLYEPVVCLVLQGRKEVTVGDRCLSVGACECLLVSHDLPVRSRVTQVPYLALVMDVDIDTVRSLRAEVGPSADEGAALQGARTHRADPGLIDALHRYLALADCAADARVLGPMVFKEIHYRLLMAPIGATLRSLAGQDTRASAIARAIQLIRDDFGSPLAVPQLARKVGMSASAFHQHFRLITATTPLQYLKEVRLLQAQRALRGGAASVTAVALDVGYASLSQFSRDYARKFGHPPSQDLQAAPRRPPPHRTGSEEGGAPERPGQGDALG